MPISVPPKGPDNPLIAFVGEAPGRQEERRREPFVGSAGKLLNRMCSSSGITMSACWKGNVMNTRPSLNDFSSFYQDKRKSLPKPELEKGRERLRETLQKVNPRIIVALGAEPLKALTRYSSITHWRGSILESNVRRNGNKERIPLIATYHPAYILRMYIWRSTAELDLKRAWEEAIYPKPLPKLSLSINPTKEDVLQYVEKCRRKKKFSFDIETVSIEKRMLVRCLGLSCEEYEGFCIPFMTLSGGMKPGDKTLYLNHSNSFRSYWTEEDEWEVLCLIKELLEDPQIKKIAQNFPFDSTVLGKEFGILVRGLSLDTMVGHFCCYPEMPKSLDYLTSIYTRIPRYSDHDASSDEAEWNYNATDALVTFLIEPKIRHEMKHREVEGFYQKYMRAYSISLTKAQNRGIEIDEEVKEELKGSRTLEAWLAIETLKKIGYPVNPNSPKQVKELFYDKLKVPTIRKRAKKGKPGRVTADEDALLKIRKKFPKVRPVVECILKYREATKEGSFINAELNENGKLETSYNLCGTVNGRLSASKPLWNVGVNIQQWPKSELRRMITAPKGNFLVRNDLSQAEARVVAWDGGIGDLIKKFQTPGFDIHTWNAANIYAVEESEITRKQRAVGKAGVHGGNYGMRPRKAAEEYGVTFHEAKRALDVYRKNIKLEEWWRRIEEEIHNTRCLSNPFGRKRVFMGRFDNNTHRSAYSFRPQSTVVDIMLQAFALLDFLLEPYNAYPYLQMHDEVVSVVPEDSRREEVFPLIKEVIEIPLTFSTYPEALIIPTNFEVGTHWYEMEEVEVSN